MKRIIYILLALISVLTVSAQSIVVSTEPSSELVSGKKYVFKNCSYDKYLADDGAGALIVKSATTDGSAMLDMVFTVGEGGVIDYTATNINSSGNGYQIGDGGDGTILLAKRRNAAESTPPYVYPKDKEGQYLMVRYAPERSQGGFIIVDSENVIVNDEYYDVYGITSNTTEETRWLAYEVILVPTAKMVYNSSTTTMHFYYDVIDHSGEGTVYSVEDASFPSWYSKINPTIVKFDASFANFRPKSCSSWFRGMNNIESIEGLEYLNTSEVTSMLMMFAQCNKLKVLDLSSFDTDKVNTMEYMFYFCFALETIYVSDKFVLKTNATSDMFKNCQKLTGGMGTTYSATNTNGAYACIDGGEEKPGYFTYPLLCDMVSNITIANDGKSFEVKYSFSPAEKAVTVSKDGKTLGTIAQGATQFTLSNLSLTTHTLTFSDGTYSIRVVVNDPTTAKVVYDEKTTTMTFYYDIEDHSGEGTVYSVPDSGFPSWYNKISPTKVKFDASFAAFRPKTCEYWFYNMSLLESIEGMEYLNTSEVTSMAYMFKNCMKLKVLDLYKFETGKVSSMYNLFSYCTSLETIYVSSKFVLKENVNTYYMFSGCENLTGGMGTTYSATNTNGAYACIDDPDNDKPGYFTKAPTAPGDLNDDGDFSVVDLTLLIKAIGEGKTATEMPEADVNGDGNVNINDINALRDEMIGVESAGPFAFNVGDKMRIHLGDKSGYEYVFEYKYESEGNISTTYLYSSDCFNDYSECSCTREAGSNLFNIKYYHYNMTYNADTHTFNNNTPVTTTSFKINDVELLGNGLIVNR